MNAQDFGLSLMLRCITWMPCHLSLAPLLFHPQFLAWIQPERSAGLLTLYQQAVDKHFTDLLRDIAQGYQPTDAERRLLVKTLQVDAAQAAIIPNVQKHHAEAL